MVRRYFEHGFKKITRLGLFSGASGRFSPL
jgi:hypothetical protein